MNDLFTPQRTYRILFAKLGVPLVGEGAAATAEQGAEGTQSRERGRLGSK